MPSVNENARRWFETMYGAGKGIGEAVVEGRKKDASVAVSEAQNQAIPTLADSTMNYEGVGGGMDPAQFEAGTAPEANLQYGQDLQAYYQRKKDALNDYARYSTPEEMVMLEEKYNERNRKKYQDGLLASANLIQQGAKPETIAAALTNAYALNPSGVSGVATPDEEGGVVMSFFDETTGKVYATAPMHDPDALRKMAAGVDDPKFQLQFNITEAELADQQERTSLIAQELKNTVAKDKAAAATNLMELDAKALQAVSTAAASMDKKLLERGDKNAKLVLAAMKERPLPEEFNGDYAQYYANATGFMTENPDMDPGAALRMTEMMNEAQLAIAYQIMDQDRNIDWDPDTMRVPPEVMSQAYQQMAAPGGLIKKSTDTKTGRVSHVYMDGKNPVYLPPVITGEGRPTTRAGLMYQAFGAQGGQYLSSEERKGLKDVVMQYTGAGRASDKDAARPATAGGVGIPAPGVKGKADTGPSNIGAKDRDNILTLADKIIAQGDSGSKNMAKLLMNVQENFGDAAAAEMANTIEQRMIQFQEQQAAQAQAAGVPAPQQAPPRQAIPAGPGGAAAYAPQGTNPVNPMAAIREGYSQNVEPRAVAIPRN